MEADANCSLSGFVKIEILSYCCEQRREISPEICIYINIYLKANKKQIFQVPAPFNRASNSLPPPAFPRLAPVCVLCASEVSPGDQIPWESHVCPVKAKEISCQGQGFHAGWRVLFSGEWAKGPDMLIPANSLWERQLMASEKLLSN